MADAGVSDKIVRRQRAIISSMTPKERRKPDILQASRKRRIAAGAGVEVAEINRLLKQHRQMQDAFKSLSKDGGRGFARRAGLFGVPGAAGGGGGMDALAALGGAKPGDANAAAGASPPPAMGGLPGLGSPRPAPKLPGLGGGLPPGVNPFKR
jgi:signal recognition particle subunit SRP54